MFNSVYPPFYSSSSPVSHPQISKPRFAGFDSNWHFFNALKDFDQDLGRQSDRRKKLPNENAHEYAITKGYLLALGKYKPDNIPIKRIVKNVMYYVRCYTLAAISTNDFAPGNTKFNELLNKDWCELSEPEEDGVDDSYYKSSGDERIPKWYQGQGDEYKPTSERPSRSRFRKLATETPEPSKKSHRTTTEQPQKRKLARKTDQALRPSIEESDLKVTESSCPETPGLTPSCDLGLAPLPQFNSEQADSPQSFHLFNLDELSRATTPGVNPREELQTIIDATAMKSTKDYNIYDVAHYFVEAHPSNKKSVIATDLICFIRDLERDNLQNLDSYLQKKGVPSSAKVSKSKTEGFHPDYNSAQVAENFIAMRGGDLDRKGFRALARWVRNQ